MIFNHAYSRRGEKKAFTKIITLRVKKTPSQGNQGFSERVPIHLRCRVPWKVNGRKRLLHTTRRTEWREQLEQKQQLPRISISLALLQIKFSPFSLPHKKKHFSHDEALKTMRKDMDQENCAGNKECFFSSFLCNCLSNTKKTTYLSTESVYTVD